MVNLERFRQYASSDNANVDLGTTFKKSPERIRRQRFLYTYRASRAHFFNTRHCCTALSARKFLMLTPRKHGTKGLQN